MTERREVSASRRSFVLVVFLVIINMLVQFSTAYRMVRQVPKERWMARSTLHMSTVGLETNKSPKKRNSLLQRLQQSRTITTTKSSSVGQPLSKASPVSVESFSTSSAVSSSSGSLPTAATTTGPFQSKQLPKAVLVERETGAFIKQFPQVHPGETHYKRAYRKTMKEIRLNDKIVNQRNAQRKYTAQFFDHLMKGLTVPITDIINIYQKNFRDLHPYEATVANLTITARMKAGKYDLQTIIGELKKLRAQTSKIGKEYASQSKDVASAVAAKELLIEGMAKLEELYATAPEANALVELTELHKDLRKIPVIELDIPAIVLVGAPNVGKSSIVRAVSSGTPEVNDYPFTTRGVTIGHIFHNADLNILSLSQQKEFAKKYQVMDTPGLLDRPEEERNEMEKLTFASLAHLPTAVVFVIDPTGLSGEQSNLQAQLNVRNYLKSRFPRRPWLDVISKGDIATPEDIQKLLPANALRVSVHTKQNVDKLQAHMTTMLEELRLMLEERKRQQKEEQAQRIATPNNLPSATVHTVRKA